MTIYGIFNFYVCSMFYVPIFQREKLQLIMKERISEMVGETSLSHTMSSSFQYLEGIRRLNER